MIRRICVFTFFNFQRRCATFKRTGGPDNYLKEYVIKSTLCRFSTLPAAKWTCESCGKPNLKNVLVCSTCERIIRPTQIKSFTYFEILDQDMAFDINTSELSKHFRKLQGLLHPDKFAQKDKTEQECSEEVSASVNVAYQTLLKPAVRAKYLLHLSGKPFEEKSLQMDQDFLAEIMEKNELLNECSTAEEAKKIQTENDKNLEKYYKEISTCFEWNNLDGAMVCLAKVNYYENINEKLKEIIMNFS